MSREWKEYRDKWQLKEGVYVKLFIFSGNPNFLAGEGIVKRSVTRRNQTRVAVDFGGKGYRVPLSWIEFFALPDAESLQQTIESQPSKIKYGDFLAEVSIGEWCLFYRNGKHFDVVRLNERKKERAWGFNPLTGKTQGYKYEWYVCRVNDEGRLGKNVLLLEK